MVRPSRRAFYNSLSKTYYENVFNQFFNLPDSIIYYIATTPISAEFYKKIIKTCKYFFIKNPIIIVSTLYCNQYEYRFVDGEVTHSVYHFFSKSKKFDLSKHFTSKIWITRTIKFDHSINRCVASLISKMYRFDFVRLMIEEQSIDFKFLLQLSSNVETFEWENKTVCGNNDSIVPLEKIVQAFPKIKFIRYMNPSFSSITSSTFKELLKIKQFSTLEECFLGNLSDNFDIRSFYNYMKGNKCTKFKLCFSPTINNAYKNHIKEIVEEIKADGNKNYKPPVIRIANIAQTFF